MAPLDDRRRPGHLATAARRARDARWAAEAEARTRAADEAPPADPATASEEPGPAQS